MSEVGFVSMADFESTVLMATKPVIVNFTASWCAPCKVLEPQLKLLAEQWKGKLSLVSIDVDQNLELSELYEVISIPLLLIFSAGQLKARRAGIVALSALNAIFEEASAYGT